MRSDEPRAGSTRRSNSGDALRERTWAVAGIDQTSRNGVPRLPAARSSPRSASPIWKGGGPNGERTQSRLMTPQSVYPQMRVPMRGQPPQDSVNTAREVRVPAPHPSRTIFGREVAIRIKRIILPDQPRRGVSGGLHMLEGPALRHHLHHPGSHTTSYW